MNEFLVFVRGRDEPIRFSAAKYHFWPSENATIFVGFFDESDAAVARLPIGDVQAIVDAKYYTPPASARRY